MEGRPTNIGEVHEMALSARAAHEAGAQALRLVQASDSLATETDPDGLPDCSISPDLEVTVASRHCIAEVRIFLGRTSATLHQRGVRRFIAQHLSGRCPITFFEPSGDLRLIFNVDSEAGANQELTWTFG